MNSRMIRLIGMMAVFTLAGLLLAACGGGETATETPETTAETAPPTETPVPPTNTPAPTPTPEPSPTPDPAAGFVAYESSAAGFRLRHPDGWFTQEIFGLSVFASAEELVDGPEPGEEGGVLVVVTGQTADFETDFNTTDPVEILQQNASDLGFEDDVTFVEGPTATTINGQDAATAVISATSDNGTPLSGVIAIIISGDHAAVIFGATPQESGPEFLPAFQAMVNTIELTEPVVTNTGPLGEGQEPEGILLFGDRMTAAVSAGTTSVWEFIGLEGESVNISVTPLSSDLDVVVDVQDASGASILERGPVDNSFGAEEISELVVPASGTYYIIVSGYSDDDAGDYEIVFTEVGGTADAPGNIAYGDSVTGAISADNAEASFSFAGSAGDVVFAVIDPAGDLDVVVDIIDTSGNSLLLAGRDNSFGVEIVSTMLPEDGEYAVLVSSFDEAETGAFDLTLSGPNGAIVYATDSLDEPGDEHAFPFTASEGDLVSIVVETEGDLDVVIDIYNEDTDEQVYSIDRALGTEAVGYRVPEDGNYYFLVRGFTAGEDGATGGADVGSYTVRVIATDTVILEIALGDTVEGRLGSDSGLIEFYFSALAGDTMVLTLETDGDIDGMLTILDLDENELASVDDNFSGETETLTYTFDNDALYVVRVRDFFRSGGTFSLLVDAGGD